MIKNYPALLNTLLNFKNWLKKVWKKETKYFYSTESSVMRRLPIMMGFGGGTFGEPNRWILCKHRGPRTEGFPRRWREMIVNVFFCSRRIIIFEELLSEDLLCHSGAVELRQVSPFINRFIARFDSGHDSQQQKIVNNRRMVVAFAFAARLDLQSVYHHLWTIKLTVVVELYFAAGEFGWWNSPGILSRWNTIERVWSFIITRSTMSIILRNEANTNKI